MPRIVLTDPLRHPLAMAAAGAVLVIGVKLLPWGWLLAPPLALLVAFGMAHQRRQATLPDLIRRALQLAAGADAVSAEAGQRLIQVGSIGRLTAIQICCQRVVDLPAKLERLGAAGTADAPRSTLLSTRNLEQRLRQERQRLAREAGSDLKRQRERLVTQLERNLALAQQGMEAGSLRVMAVSEHLESVAGDLQELQVQLRQPELPAAPAWSVDHPDSEGDPSLDPLTADLHAELDELDHLLREALGA